MPLCRPQLFSLFAAACLLGSGAWAGEPPHYTLDPVHTRILLMVDHAGFSKAIGTVSGSMGVLVFDPDDWKSARLKANVPMTRVDFGDPRWNKAVLASNLLNVADHPVAEFVSTRIEPIAADHASIYGMLTLNGVSREIVLDTRLNAAKRHPLPPFRRTIGFSATTTLSRKAFGVDAWPTVIGDSVELRIEAEAIRGHADGGGDTATPDPGDSNDISPSATDPHKADSSDSDADHANSIPKSATEPCT
jgi:polyisoprenoid-binding protein YceI